MKVQTVRKRVAGGMLAMLLSVCMVFTMMPMVAFAAGGSGAADSYAGKTVILYSGNLRGDVDKYAQLAKAKADFEAKNAEAVFLVDAGNYLQGSTYANTSRGEAIYMLMDVVGYDVAAMGAYEFAYGDASTGQKWHGNFTKFYTQKMLYEGVPDDFVYAKNREGTVTGTLLKKDPATFKVISSNITGESAAELDGAETTVGKVEKLFSFDSNCVLTSGSLSIGFAAQTDPFGLNTLQNGLEKGLAVAETTALPVADVIIGLSNDGKDVAGAAKTISAPTDGDAVMGALVIDNTTKNVEEATVDFSQKDDTVAGMAEIVKALANEVVAKSNVTLVGKNTKHRYEESEMGDLVTDALLWYGSNMEGFQKDVPLVAIQNGANVRKTIHKGDVIFNDIFNGYPYSPTGVGILYVTGEQLLESLEEANYDNPSNAFPQVAGMTYNIDLTEAYDASTTKGENHDGKYGNYFLADSYNRVSITSIGGKPFDPKATYAVVGDNVVVANGLDTYGTFKEIADKAKAGDGTYINNGSGVLVRNVVEKYLKEECGGQVPAKYAKTQGRITFGDSSYKKAKAAADTAKASGNVNKYLAAAKQLEKEAAATLNPDKIKEAEAVVAEATKAKEEADGTAKKIKESKITLKTVKAGKKKFTATWKKNSDVAGYEVWYKTGSKAKTVKVTSNATTKKVVKKLKKGKKYSVKVRGYRNVGGEMVYTQWSKAKKVKIK